MLLKDKNGNSINIEQVMGFYVDTNPDGGYEVRANNADNVVIARFVVNAPMTQAEAEALLERISDTLGTLDLAD